MARPNTKKSETVRHAHRCTVCGVLLRLEEWSHDESSTYGGLAPEQYVELFWDEA